MTELENAKCSSDEEEDGKSLHLADLWSKSERESGVKLDIQEDATNKKIQQPKYDALTNCDTEHVTHNLVFYRLAEIEIIFGSGKRKFVRYQQQSNIAH